MQREFRVTFVEIHNEEIKDLLLYNKHNKHNNNKRNKTSDDNNTNDSNTNTFTFFNNSPKKRLSLLSNKSNPTHISSPRSSPRNIVHKRDQHGMCNCVSVNVRVCVCMCMCVR